MDTFRRGYALVAGIANYPNVSKLPSAVLYDAIDFAAVLWEPYSCGYPPEQVRLIYDERATKQAIVEGLQWLAESTTEGDTAVFFFSGHGARRTSATGLESFLLAYDAGMDGDGAGLISSAELSALLKKVHATRVGIFLDSCFAGDAAEIKGGMQTQLEAGLHKDFYLDLLSTGSGRAILASSDGPEESLILDGMRNSLFTHYLLRALKGEAPRSNEATIGILDVFSYLDQQVPAHDGRQHPVLLGKTRNYPIALAPRPNLAPHAAAHSQLLEQRTGPDRRKRPRRRGDRRVSPLLERMQVGLRKAFLKKFDDGSKWQPVNLDDPRTFDVLLEELKRYAYRKDGRACSPRDVLEQVSKEVKQKLKPRGSYRQDYQEALIVVEDILTSLLREYETRMKACMPRDWLDEINRRFEYRVPYNEKHLEAAYILEVIAKTILREYEVSMRDRRVGDRRTTDRRKMSQALAARPEEKVASALGNRFG